MNSPGNKLSRRRQILVMAAPFIAAAGLLAAVSSFRRENGPSTQRQDTEQATTPFEDEFLKTPAFSDEATLDDLKREAVRAAEELLEAYPDDIDSLRIAARLHSGLGNSDEAVKMWQRCVEIDPGCVDAHYSMGRVALKAGNFDEAAKILERVVLLAPSWPEPPALLADVLMKLGKPDEVVTLLQGRVHDQIVLDKALVILGQAYLQLEEYEKARDTLQTLIKADPEEARAYYLLGRVYARLGQSEESRRSLEKFKSFGSVDYEGLIRDVRAHVDLSTVRAILVATLTEGGRVYRMRDKAAEAEEAWRKAITLDPDNPKCRQVYAIIKGKE